MGRTKTYISIDIEAALIRGKQYIIEIGAVKWLPDGTTETFTQLIQPYKFKRLNAHIQKLTGIKTEQLLDAPSFKEAFNKFKRWCKQDYVFLTFGEFDRKVLEEELARNYIKNDCLYPMIDFQQKYMIANALKEQPSLGGLMAQLGLENEIQHRALADAASLLEIFIKVDGASLISQQQTNDFLLLLTNFRMLESTYELVISATKCKVENEQIHIHSMKTFRDELPFTVQTIERLQEDGEVITTEKVTIQPNKQAKEFLQQIALEAKDNILVSRTALRSISKILKLHQVAFPKTEVMTLTNLLKKEEIISQFNFIDESSSMYEKRIVHLISKFEKSFTDEFYKRALIEKETIQV